MPLWQLKDKRASVDRKENIQSSHLDSALWTAPEWGSTGKRQCYKGSWGGIGWALACVTQAGWGAAGRQGAGVCSVPALCCPLVIQHAACVEIAFHWGLEFYSSHLVTHQHALTAFKSCKTPAFSGATGLLVFPVLISKAALHIGQEWAVRQKDACTSQPGDWAPWNPMSRC